MSVEGIRPFDVARSNDKRGSTDDHESHEVAAAWVRQATKGGGRVERLIRSEDKCTP